MNKTRAGNNSPKKQKGPGKIEKIYYIVIGLLIVILGGLVIFIFSNRDDVDTEGNQDNIAESELITDNGEDETDEDTETEEPVDEETEEDAETEVTDEDESETDTETTDGDSEDEAEEDAEDTEETTEEEESADDEEETEADINADAPLDESYTINFTDGSSDRNAISQNASAASGINQSSMITWWVGNNGSGRAFTIISDSDQNSVYRVDLQYGEGSWHVTSAQELDGVPSEYR